MGNRQRRQPADNGNTQQIPRGRGRSWVRNESSNRFSEKQCPQFHLYHFPAAGRYCRSSCGFKKTEKKSPNGQPASEKRRLLFRSPEVARDSLPRRVGGDCGSGRQRRECGPGLRIFERKRLSDSGHTLSVSPARTGHFTGDSDVVSYPKRNRGGRRRDRRSCSLRIRFRKISAAARPFRYRRKPFSRETVPSAQ